MTIKAIFITVPPSVDQAVDGGDEGLDLAQVLFEQGGDVDPAGFQGTIPEI
jgi:hypothetical protein